MIESGRILEFEELVARYNRAFYDRDLAALRVLYVPDVDVPYFDNHADGDSTDLDTHLEKVATFFDTGGITPLLVENMRAFVYGDAARVVATVRATLGNRYVEFGHRSSWSVMRLHGGFAISTSRRIQKKQADNACIKFVRYPVKTL